MDKLTGHGRPSPKFAGEVGQHYEDLDTGDIYECRIASEHSPTHGWPVGGYVWERRAKGEDIREIYGSGGSGGMSVETVRLFKDMANSTGMFEWSGGTASFYGDSPCYFNSEEDCRSLIAFLCDFDHVCRIIQTNSNGYETLVWMNYNVYDTKYPGISLDDVVYGMEEL